MKHPLVLLAAASLVACNVESRGRDTGGIDLPDGGSTDAPRGFIVVSTDYGSTSVGLLSPEGEVRSESFIASGSVKPGLSAALSGDVVVPSGTVPGREAVLLDRQSSVLSWVNLETAAVRAQLSVATGFFSNPHDYIPYSDTVAFVPRFEPNLDSGREPFDGGNDVLVVDPAAAAITGRIDLSPVLDGESAGFYPRADRGLLISGRLVVLAPPSNVTFTEYLDSRLVVIDPESFAIVQVLLLPGMKSCDSVERSPQGREIVVLCDGMYGQDAAGGFSDSGIVFVSVGDELSESKRFTAKDLGIDQVSAAAFSGPDTLVVVTSGRLNADNEPEAYDKVRVVNVRTGEVGPVVLESKVRPFMLGEIRCEPPDGHCFVTDAETESGVLQELALDGAGAATAKRRIKVDVTLGLPPRNLGRF